MDINNYSNNSNNNIYESNSQTTFNQTYDMYTSVTYGNNNAISDQQPNVVSPNHNHQQHDDSSNISHYNYQQYIQQSGFSNNDVTVNPGHNYHFNYQQPTSNVVSNNNVNFSSGNNNNDLNNIPHYNNQQSMTNNVSYPQFYHDQYQHNSLQSNILPLLNSFGININSPQATIIIMPTTNSDIQNQLQQILNYLNHSSSSKIQ
ncbi:hypothetical protein RclHR1_00850022 [Rhizophagus clarus]|uniref:Uncharacterized protein n=1 Tax=Rhizophagus clarus TaxID=94130 RepID=A0A2Z6S398_9GLOM|nr:hypothetical protein RclHR1_00850022 [Rhizophagus clarus]GES98092.1 hypothetical protein GLOIN_2v1471941 [Rhizophagus clarus]